MTVISLEVRRLRAKFWGSTDPAVRESARQALADLGLDVGPPPPEIPRTPVAGAPVDFDAVARLRRERLAANRGVLRSCRLKP